MTNIDFTKYKRVFAFGCSYTSYAYPTWADILFTECVNAELHNFGRAGAGNTQIGSNVVQIDLRFNFCETDLVMIMYTSPMREDRYINGNWIALGNVFNQNYYDKNFVKNYCDPIGLLIKDYSNIALIKRYVNSLNCDSLQLLGDDYNSDIGSLGTSAEELQLVEHIQNVFKPIVETFTNPRLQKEGGFNGFHKYDNQFKKFIKDGHPNPKEYLEFLQGLNLNLTENSFTYVKKAMDFINSGPHMPDKVNEAFPELMARFRDSNIHLL